MGPFDAIRHRADRRQAAETYRDRLAYLTHEASAGEVERASQDAAAAAGEYLTPQHRRAIDEEVRTRLSLSAAAAYGDDLVAIPLETILDGSWPDAVAAAQERYDTWLRDAHRDDQHWQVTETVLHDALEQGRVSDEDIRALDGFVNAIDPDGAATLDEPWWQLFARARLATGLLPRPRATSRLLTQGGEVACFCEEGTVLETIEWLDAGDRQRTRVDEIPVEIACTDRRIAVFADELVFSTRWAAVVGVRVGEDEHGTFVLLDDADAHTSHVVHTRHAELLGTLAAELHRRTGV